MKIVEKENVQLQVEDNELEMYLQKGFTEYKPAEKPAKEDKKKDK